MKVQKVLLRNLKETQLSEGASTWITFLFVSLGLLKGRAKIGVPANWDHSVSKKERRLCRVHINLEETPRKETAGHCLAGQARKQICSPFGRAKKKVQVLLTLALDPILSLVKFKPEWETHITVCACMEAQRFWVWGHEYNSSHHFTMPSVFLRQEHGIDWWNLCASVNLVVTGSGK